MRFEIRLRKMKRLLSIYEIRNSVTKNETATRFDLLMIFIMTDAGPDHHKKEATVGDNHYKEARRRRLFRKS